jgi:hypothetical protein
VCSPAAAPPGSGEVPAGEPNNEAPRTPPNDGVHCEIPFHPLANTFPMLDEESQLAMARDIRERGQFEAIVLYQEQILDGRCRYRACLSAEVVPKFEEYQGDDPLGYVVSRNIHRRHLLKDSQRALVAARLASLPVGANRYSEGVSIDAACKLLRVTPTAVNRAKKILRRGIPDVVKAVEDGSLTIWKALLLAKLRKSEQQAEMDRLAASESPVVEASNSPNLPAATEPSEGQVETSDSDNATGAAKIDAPAAEQPKAGPEVSCSSPSSATLPSTPIASWRRIPHYDSDEWIWPGYVPTSAVTVIAGGITAPTALLAVKISATVITGGGWPGWHSARRGEVAWLSAQPKVERTLHNQVLAAGGMIDGVDLFCHVHALEAAIDDYGLPIHHLARALWLLDQEIQTKGNLQVAVVDYLFPYVASGVEQNIARLQPAFAAMNEIAVKHHFALVALCPFPYRGGRDEIAQATAALADIPDVHSLLFVEGGDHGTIMPTKIVSGAHPPVLQFRTGKRPGYSEPSVSAIIFEDGWDQLIPNRKPRRKRPRPGRRGRLSNIRP